MCLPSTYIRDHSPSQCLPGLNPATTPPKSLRSRGKFLPLSGPQFLCKIQEREHLCLKVIHILLLYKTESRALLCALPCTRCQWGSQKEEEKVRDLPSG